MRSTTILILTIFSFLHYSADGQEMDKEIQRGNELYKQKQYQQAEAVYSEVLAKEPTNMTAKFNRANALYRQSKNEETIKVLNDLAFKTEDPELKSKAYYNKGVTLSGQKRLEESIEAYKEALRRNSADKEARENLQKALLELKKKEPPKKDDKKQKQQQQQQQKKQQQQQPKMNQKEAEQRLRLLEQKEKDVQQRLQKEKSRQGGGQQKDW